MDINKFLDGENCYKQKISQSEKRIREEQELLNEARDKYYALRDKAYQEGMFKLTLGKLKEAVASYNKIPVSQINLSLKGSAELFFDPDFKNYREIVYSLKRYPRRFVKVMASLTSQENNLKISISPYDICDFLMDNENLFSTDGSLNNNLQIENGFGESGGKCVLRTKISFAPECIENVSINFHPDQLAYFDYEDKESYEVLKPTLIDYLEKQSKEKE